MTQSGPEGGEEHSASSHDEGLYSTVFDHSNDAIFVTDPASDRIVDANPRASSMQGYSHGELCAIPISAVHPNELPALRAFAQSVFDNGRRTTEEAGLPA